MSRPRLILALLGGLLALVLCGVCGTVGVVFWTAPRTAALDVGTPARIKGFDAQGTPVDPVNVWKDYEDRGQGTVGQVHDNDLVMVLKRTDEAAQIRLDDGAVGWVNNAFLR